MARLMQATNAPKYRLTIKHIRDHGYISSNDVDVDKVGAKIYLNTYLGFITSPNGISRRSWY